MPVRVSPGAMSSLHSMQSPSTGPSLFSAPTGRSQATTDAFMSLKSVCIPIMAIKSLSPANYSTNLSLLSTLRRTLYEFPSESLDDIFTPPLINYAVFPLTSLLQRNDPLSIRGRLLEEIFTSLAFLVERYKHSEAGIAVKTWEQFWTLTSIVLGGPPSVGQTGQDKGKRKELDDELKISCLRLLESLLQRYEGMFGTEEEPSHPSLEHLNTVFTSKSLTPILFHTISTLLDLITPPSPNLSIKLSSIRLLRLIVTTYMRGKNEMLASVMPGAMSTMIKVVAGEGALLKAEFGKEICGFVGELVVGTVGDDQMVKRGVLKSRVTSLDQLVNEVDTAAEGSPPDAAPASQVNGMKSQPFPDLTPQYLAYTQTQVLASLRNLIPPLQVHSSSTVREALVHTACDLLEQCSRSMPLTQQPLLSTLLLLSRDEFESVSSAASSTLVALLTEDKVGTELYGHIRTILESSITAFPQQVMARNDIKVQETTRIITAIGAFTTRISSRSYSRINLVRSILGPDGGVQKWGWSLLRCLELDREPEIQVRIHAGQRAWELAQGQLGWNAVAGMIEDSTENSSAQDQSTPYPALSLHYVESKATFRAVSDMFETLGQAAGEDALYTIEHFVQLSRTKRLGSDVAQSSSALWVAERLLTGVGKASDGGSRRTRKIASGIVDILVMLDDEDEDNGGDGDDGLGGDIDPSSAALIPVERTKGMDSVSLLLNKASTRTTTAEQAESRRLHLRMHRQLVAALSMSLMAVSADILGSAFRPLLLRCLYIVLSYLGSPSPFLQQYAHASLVRIAYHAGYASPQNLVMDNVDYVINVVSQRLTYRRLSPLAPMVLISMIRLVGEPIVPLVQDVVDDIFDVLDDFHGYELLCSTLLAVLDTLIKAMTSEAALVSWQPKRSTSSRLQPPPDPARDFSALAEWYEQRSVKAKSAVEDYLAKAPQKPWKEEAEEADDVEEPPTGTRDEPEVPPTRQQEVCKQILTKAVYFMSHSSAFIRARVLGLFAGGISVLVVGDRESDLLPIVHQAWPYLLNRLKDKEPFVVTEAAAVVEALAKYVGDFMSKRILDHAWPTMKGLLDTQAKLDERSAMVTRNRKGLTTDYTVSHRLYIAIIASMQYIVQEVPITDELFWEMIMAFLPFLDATANEETQKAAVMLYRQMAVRDEDAVWLALRGVQGTVGPHATTYLRQPGLDISYNARMVLAE